MFCRFFVSELALKKKNNEYLCVFPDFYSDIISPARKDFYFFRWVAKKVGVWRFYAIKREGIIMTKKMTALKRALSVLLLILTVMSSVTVISVTAGTAGVTKAEETYDIALVFDNSGSMYYDIKTGDQSRWCYAKYAMEIFASMLDYEKDRLRIFPMWELTYDGKTIPKPDKALSGDNIIAEDESGNPIGKYDPIEIKSVSDIDYIHNIYTTRWAAGTPYAPIVEAHNALKDSKASQRWIVVLSDGEFTLDSRNTSASFSKTDLEKRLLAITKDDINVQYLGFGSATQLTATPDRGFYTQVPDSEKPARDALKDSLVEVCNRIFKRDELKSKYLNGTELTLDISMRKLIVFVQGNDAKVGVITDGSGNSYKPVMDAGQRKYSEIIAYGYTGGVDNSLAGQVVTFGELPKGKYNLEYSGADKIQIFYEPDVDIDVVLVNSDGVEIKGSEEGIPVGEYKVIAKIVDRNTGEDVTDHELMGGNVDIRVKVKTSKDGDFKEYENGATINLTEDEDTKIVIVGTYLEDYTITSEGDPDLEWMTLGFDVIIPAHDFKIETEVTQPEATYKIKEHDSWQPVKLKASLEGAPLTDEQMKNIQLTLSCDPELAVRYEIIPGESAYNVYISETADGGYKEPQAGDYTLSVSARYVDNNSETPANASAAFKIEGYEFAVDAKVLQFDSWYTLSKHDDWQPVKVTLTIDGEPLTEEQFSRVDFKHVLDKEGLVYRAEPLPSESAYMFYIGQDEKGEYVAPETGDYKMTFTATYTSEGGNDVNAEDNASFGVHKVGPGFKYLLIAIILGTAIFLWLVWMLQKVMPKDLEKKSASFKSMSHGTLDGTMVDVEYRSNDRTLAIKSPACVDFTEKCDVTLSLKPLNTRFTPKGSRCVAVVDISSTGNEVVFGAAHFVNYNGKWVKSNKLNDAKKENYEPVEESLSSSVTIKVVRPDVRGNLECKVKFKN